jgi:glycosyltransferase involved in cell wall biosynthesis
LVFSGQLAARPRFLLVSDPLVSIVIPCHNAARWLAATLDSAFAQTWPNTEIVLVDDGSTDDSLSSARRYESRGLKVITQPNRGAAAARNTGLRAARGDFIQYLDSDDLLAPDKIAQQMPLFSDGSRTRLSSSTWARFTVRPEDAVVTLMPNWRDLTGVEFLQLHFETGGMMQPAAWLAPRALLDRAGPWNESLSLNDDGEYFARVMLAAERIVFCQAAKTYYRSNIAGSLGSRKDHAALDSLYRSIDLTLAALLATDPSPRTRAAAAHAWKWIAFELYPGAPELSRLAERNSRRLGGSHRAFPAGGRFQLAARLLGWRLAKRLTLP